MHRVAKARVGTVRSILSAGRFRRQGPGGQQKATHRETLSTTPNVVLAKFIQYEIEGLKAGVRHNKLKVPPV